jgi:hypothetical protein
LQLARAVIATVVMAACWVAFDHCALASVFIHSGHSLPAEERCPGHSRPEKKPSQGELPCCKMLVATAAPAKISAGYDTNLFAVQPYLAAEFASVFSRFDLLNAELDTGPPGRRTFAESVLQRSLRAHAPPSLG